MGHYFNEFDPGAAEWLRELMKVQVIPQGEVDERDIQDLTPDDLRGHRSVHLFAGIGVWAYALRLAGWPNDRPVWTCSCPCQPFSAAGKGDGFADERHLWPAAFHLLSECRPVVCFGEQVASDDGFAWLDLVQADLESVGYTVGAIVTPAAGYGAPHGRHRIYWVADATGERQRGQFGDVESATRTPAKAGHRRSIGNVAQRGGAARSLANPVGRGRNGRASVAGRGSIGGDVVAGASETSLVADADGGQSRNGRVQPGGLDGQQPQDGGAGELADSGHGPLAERTRQARRKDGQRKSERGGPGEGRGPCNGFWADAEWIHCAPEPDYPEGRWRPVEPGTFPLAHGVAGRVGLLRGYGNGLCAPQAAAFVKAWQEMNPT